MASARSLLALTLALGAVGCDAAPDLHPGLDQGGTGDGKADRASADLDIARTDLDVDVRARSAVAGIELAAPRSGTVAFEAQGLTIDGVDGPEGPLQYDKRGGLLVVQIGEMPISHVDVRYRFEVQREFNGFLEGGSTNTWPHHCGNLFPCNSSPADGLQFSLALRSVPDGQTAIYPERIDVDVPSYQLAWAVGDYRCSELGRTRGGTRVDVCPFAGGEREATDGTRNLVAAQQWFETQLGRYEFGDRIASVAAHWGEDGAGGMEHHPFFHVAADTMSRQRTQIHEAAHAWYGDGVRMQCWEDLVLSEGTVSYLTARATGQAVSAEAETALWAEYRADLERTLQREDIVAWPSTCGEVDILRDGLYSVIVYMKGAFFYRAVADAIGAAELDDVLARFYAEHRGRAARMQDMVDFIHDRTDFDATDLANHWLRSKGDPF